MIYTYFWSINIIGYMWIIPWNPAERTRKRDASLAKQTAGTQSHGTQRPLQMGDYLSFQPLIFWRITTNRHGKTIFFWSPFLINNWLCDKFGMLTLSVQVLWARSIVCLNKYSISLNSKGMTASAPDKPLGKVHNYIPVQACSAAKHPRSVIETEETSLRWHHKIDVGSFTT